jgi:hypothetical protein
MGWKLSEGHPESLRYILKRAWLDGIAVHKEDLRTSISVYYKYGDECCKVSAVDKECSRSICECYAPALCYSSKDLKDKTSSNSTVSHYQSQLP